MKSVDTCPMSHTHANTKQQGDRLLETTNMIVLENAWDLPRSMSALNPHP